MRRFAFALAVLIALVGMAMSASRADSPSRIAGNHPLEAERRVAIGNLDASQPLGMEIHLKLRNEAELDRFLTDVQNPQSPQYRKFLKAGEFDQKYGPLQSDLEAVADWLRGEGFTVTSTSGSVQFTGMVAQAERTFAVQILKLSATEFSNVEDPIVPAQFASLIGDIEGLNNLMQSQPVMKIPANLKKLAKTPMRKLSRKEVLSSIAGGASALAQLPDVDIGGEVAYGDMDMRNTYDVPSDFTLGSGDCLAIVGTSDISTAALTAFTNQFSDLPPIHLKQKLNGSNPGTNSANIEAYLDIEWSHVMAPGAPQVFYYGNLQNAIKQAIAEDTCSIISISFEFCGNQSSFYTSTLDGMFVKAASQGQAVFISTGDHGAAGSVPSSGTCVAGSGPNPLVSEMAADPNVTAVGGSEILSPNYDQNEIDQGYPGEVVWDDPNNGDSSGEATGGGASMYFSKPSYQTGPGVPADGKRDIPDVVLLGGPPAVFVGSAANGKGEIICCVDGTSLAAPLWAGVGKDLEEMYGRIGPLNPAIYTLANQQYGPSGTANGFHDITSGNNSFNGVTGYSAGTAYDQASGWGSIDFAVFAAAFQNAVPVPTTMVLGSPTTVNFGNVDASSSSKPRKVLFINRGTNAAFLGMVTVPTGFSLTADACSNQTVPARKDCAVMVEFSPLTPMPSSGAMSVSYNGAAPATVNLSGNGTAVSVKGPARAVFPTEAPGGTGPSRPVTIINESRTATVTMGTASISGPFTKASDTCSGQPIGPRGRCVIGLQFTPPDNATAKSTLTDTLSLSFTYGSNAGTVPSIPLSGTVK